MRLKKLCGLLIFAGLLGCSSLSNEGNRRFTVNAEWVQNTLKIKNTEFRKVNRMSPVIYKKSVIIGNSIDGLVSYDLNSRSQNWRVEIPKGVEASGTAIKDRLFSGSNNGKMYAIDLKSGEVLWTFDTKSELVAEPLLDEGILYFVSGSQSLYALDASNGRQMWIHNRQDTSNSMTVRGGSKPAISNGIIYAGFSDGSMVALNAKTGTEQWEITLNRDSRFRDIDSSPILDEDRIYVNSYDDKLYCLSKDKGEIVWSAPFGGSGTPLIAGDKIYTVSSQGDLVALAKKDAAVLWKKKASDGIFTDPVSYLDLIVTGESQGKLLFLKADNGQIAGSFEPGRGVFSRPTILDDMVYFVSGEGNAYGIRAAYTTKASIYYLK
jgi:outer membrane protein assembly factor BamB